MRAKIVKIILGVLGVSLVSGIIVKERNTINDFRKRLFEVRNDIIRDNVHPKHNEETK